MEPDCWNSGFNDYFSEITYKEIDRIEKEEILDHGAVIINGIEDSGHVHQQLSKNRPEVLNIPEEDKKGRKD